MPTATPVEGVYWLAGDIGELAVPDSLHALLAARLDALDPEVRQLVADAAVLAIEEAREIAERLRCQPLLDRATVSVAADPQTTPW